MTLALDTSALLARYVEGPERDVVLAVMAADADWCACALALTEALMLVERFGVDRLAAADVRSALRDDWQRMAVVPVDDRCLDLAAELGRSHPIRTVDALHLDAADRLPRPTTYCTFDPNQIPVALALGFEVVST